jgi:hypothetical protein
MNVLSYRAVTIDIPKRYLLVSDVESCKSVQPTLVVNTRFVTVEKALAFARRIDLNNDKKLYIPVRPHTRLRRIATRVYNLLMSSSLADPFAGYFVTKQTGKLQAIGDLQTVVLLDILHSALTPDEIAEIEIE